MNGINLNNLHSYDDFHLILNSRVISTPSKKKIKSDVPGMNSTWDFSTVASNGEIIYNQRTIVCNFTLICNSKAQLQSEMSKIAEWLQDTPQSRLIFDDISDYYFMAEVENEIPIPEEHSVAEFTVVFTAEPFKTSLDFVGNDIWDTFNFNEDYMQTNEYDVVGSKSITLYNPGRLIMPTINCSANMSITVNSKVYSLVTGDNKNYGLKLKNGANNIVINGSGHIKFIFRKVSL